MNELKTGVLILEKEESEDMIIFIAEEPNLSYTFNSNEKEYNINFTYRSRDIEPAVAFVARRSGDIVSMCRIVLTDDNEIKIQERPFGMAHWLYYKDSDEKLIDNGVCFTQHELE